MPEGMRWVGLDVHANESACAVFDAGTEDGRPFLVMELLRGEDLGQRLRRTGRVDLAEALHVVAQVLKGLAGAHASGIVHRDLKPDNVFLLQRGEGPTFAKIVDFGISKIDRPRSKTSSLALTGRGTVLGTPFYMSPEQARGSKIDHRSDLYSVGVVMYQAVTGRLPFNAETFTVPRHWGFHLTRTKARLSPPRPARRRGRADRRP